MSIPSPSLHSCRLCRSSATHFDLRSKGYAIWACETCGFKQTEDVPSADFLNQLYADLHTTHLQFRSNASAQIENQRRLGLLNKWLPKGATLLDAGCANGDFLDAAKDRYQVSGVDISAGAIAQSAQRFPQLKNRLKAMRLEDLGSEFRDLDAVCCWDVIEHLPDPDAVLGALMASLKPGGLLFISTPDVGSTVAKLMGRHWPFMIPPYHLGYFSRHSFHYVFEHLHPAQVLSTQTRGKSVVISFILYKLAQINRALVPSWLLNWVARSWIGRIRLYVPSNDIIYMVVQKNILSNTAGKSLCVESLA
jgi:2-polyprenyl-3-methyl-5-hydroxy-6-metoxy-1,4-benzoquinol methylase